MRRKSNFPSVSDKRPKLTHWDYSADGKKTLKQFAAAAADAKENTAPSSTGGGELGAAATATSTATPSSTTSAAPNAGMEARGDIRWGLMSLGVAVAGLVGGLMA